MIPVIRLCQGLGSSGQSHCVMGATSIVAEEKFSDRPRCVCPTIRAALIKINDACIHNRLRSELLSHLPWLIIGTHGTLQHMVKRARLFATKAQQYTHHNIDAAFYAKAANQVSKISAHATANYAAHAAAYAIIKTAKTEDAQRKIFGDFIAFIEREIIPVYTTMPPEPNYRIGELQTC